MLRGSWNVRKTILKLDTCFLFLLIWGAQFLQCTIRLIHILSDRQLFCISGLTSDHVCHLN